MWPQLWIKERDDLVRELSRWEGAMAEPWEYSVSHGQFLLRLHLPESSPAGSLFVLCKNCRHVAFQGSWRDARIVLDEKKSSLGPEFQISDGDRLIVRATAVFATKSPDYHVSLHDQ